MAHLAKDSVSKKHRCWQSRAVFLLVCFFINFLDDGGGGKK